MPRSCLRPSSRCSPTRWTRRHRPQLRCSGPICERASAQPQGPIREHYIGATPSAPTTFTATEICWPIFSTTPRRHDISLRPAHSAEPAVTQIRSSHGKAPAPAFISASVGVRLRRRQLVSTGRSLSGVTGCITVTRPNFLVIVADDLGFSDIEPSAGKSTLQPGSPCPHRHQAHRFPLAPACSPTRAMLLTGTDHHVAGIGTMLEMAAPEFQGAPATRGI